MENKHISSITKFDSIYTSNHIQILKILMPFFAPMLQKQIALYIKYMELLFTLSKTRTDIQPPFIQVPFISNIEPLYEDIYRYLNSDEQEKFTQIKQTLKSFQDMQDTMEMFKMMQETMSEDEMNEFMKGQFNFF